MFNSNDKEQKKHYQTVRPLLFHPFKSEVAI